MTNDERMTILASRTTVEQTNNAFEFARLGSFRNWKFVIRAPFVIWVSSFLIHGASAQEFPAPVARLSRDYFKNGDQTLLAFAPISRATRDSVVKIDRDGNTVALA